MRVSFSFVFVLSWSLLSGRVPVACAQDNAAPVSKPLVSNPPVPTTEERSALRRAQNEMRLRAMMNDFGIEGAAPQDALIAYLAEDETGKIMVRGAARRLFMAVRKGAPPARMRDLIAVYKAAIDADRERRRAAQSSLDAKIGFSLDPRLEATLWLLGVLGEGQSGLSPSASNARLARNGDGIRDGARDGVRDGVREIDTRRGAAPTTATGVVTRKSEGWIEVRTANDATERYLPFWTDDDNRTDPISGAPLNKTEVARLNSAVLETLARVQIGERVRLDWIWSTRKRIVRLDILPPETAPLEGALKAPNNPATVPYQTP